MFRNGALTIGVAVLLTAAPALAQEATAKYPPPCDPSHVTQSDVDQAHAVFLSGKEFLEESNYDKAISYFEDAYSIDCSVHAILPIIATAYERKGDKAEAIRALQEYLRRAPDAPDHDIVERRIKNLTDQLAHEPAPAAPAIAAASSAPAASAAPVQPPPAPAAGPAQARAAAPARQDAPERSGVAPWVLIGAGGSALAAAIVIYTVGASDIAVALGRCPNRACTTANAEDVARGNDGRALENWGGVVGGVGLAATAAGLIWRYLGRPSTSSRSAAIHPIAAPGYLGAAGAF